MTALQYHVAVDARIARPLRIRPGAVKSQKPRSMARKTWASAGALGGIRTPNLLIRSQMLYPLSYERRASQSLT
jgi:hypothetical protein